MKTLGDLQTAMYDYKDLGVAMVINEAIDAVINNKGFTVQTELNRYVLGEIRQSIIDKAHAPASSEERKEKVLGMLISAFSGNSGNVVEDSLQYIEALMR